MRKKLFKVLIIAFVVFAFLHTRAMAAEISSEVSFTDELYFADDGTLTLKSGHASQEGVSSFSLSLQVESAAGKTDPLEVQFLFDDQIKYLEGAQSEPNAKVYEYTYDNGKLNLYVAGASNLFSHHSEVLQIGKIDVKEEDGTPAYAKITVADDSLQYAYPEGARTMTVKEPDQEFVNEPDEPITPPDPDEPAVETPAAPVLKKITPAASGKAELTWKKAKGADGYYVYRKDNGKWKRIADVKSGDTTSCTLKGMVSGTKYTYTVKAYVIVDQKVYGGGYDKAGISTYYLSKPAAVKAGGRTASSLKISWKKVTGASGYRIYRSAAKDSGYKKIHEVTKGSTVSWTNKSLSSAKSYYYKVKAYKVVKGKTYVSVASSSARGTTKPAAPSLTVRSKKAKSAVLSWKRVTGADGYVIYRASGKDGYKKVKTLTNGRTMIYANTGLKKGKTYAYKMKAYKTVSGTKVYSSYGKVRKVKVK